MRKVAASHTTVVAATVTIMIQAKSTGLSLSRPATVCSSTDTTNAATIAATSLQALMRHQYHRNSSTLPVPAPVTRSSFQAPAIDPMYSVATAEITVSSTVAAREAST